MPAILATQEAAVRRGVAQGEGHEFKPPHHIKNKKQGPLQISRDKGGRKNRGNTSSSFFFFSLHTKLYFHLVQNLGELRGG
jgi:hypothetical protein